MGAAQQPAPRVVRRTNRARIQFQGAGRIRLVGGMAQAGVVAIGRPEEGPQMARLPVREFLRYGRLALCRQSKPLRIHAGPCTPATESAMVSLDLSERRNPDIIEGGEINLAYSCLPCAR